MRVQFASAIAANSQQGNAWILGAVESGPCLLQYLIGKPGALMDQLSDIAPALKAALQRVVGVPYGFFESADRTAF